jgi:hypothetical protein
MGDVGKKTASMRDEKRSAAGCKFGEKKGECKAEELEW